MSDLFDKFSPGEFIALAAVIVGPLIAITAIITTQWRRVRIAEMEATLKQQMLDKGMSAAEIEQVMTVNQRQPGSTGDVRADRAYLVQCMIAEGYEGEDIERVLKAYEPLAKHEEKPVATDV